MDVVFHTHWIDKLAVFTGILSGLALYPQVFIIVGGDSTAGVSLVTYAVIFANSIVWLAYSIHRSLLSLAIPSVLNIFASGAVVVWFLTV